MHKVRQKKYPYIGLWYLTILEGLCYVWNHPLQEWTDQAHKEAKLKLARDIEIGYLLYTVFPYLYTYSKNTYLMCIFNHIILIKWCPSWYLANMLDYNIIWSEFKL